MTKKNPENDPLDLFPIPNDAIYINSKKNLLRLLIQKDFMHKSSRVMQSVFVNELPAQ